MGKVVELVAGLATIATAAVGVTLFLVRKLRRPSDMPRGLLSHFPEPPQASLVGRDPELQQLSQLCARETTRMVILVGGGGIGKTALTAEFCRRALSAQRLLARLITLWPWVPGAEEPRFSKIRWAAVRLRPDAEELVADLILSLADRHVNLGQTLDTRVDQLLQLLGESRNLLVVDNVESVLASDRPKDRATRLEYLHIFQRLAEVRHRSTIILTSRVALVGAGLPGTSKSVVELPLADLSANDALELLKRNLPSGTALSTTHVPRNPLLIELLALHLASGRTLPPDLSPVSLGLPGEAFREIVDWHIRRMSPSERAVAYQVALFAAGVHREVLKSTVFPALMPDELEGCLTRLGSSLGLQRRSNDFSFHQVVSELLVEHLLEQVVQEVQRGQFDLLRQTRISSTLGSDADLRINQRQLVTPLGDRVRGSGGALQLYGRGLGSARGDNSNLAGNLATLAMSERAKIEAFDLSDNVFRYVDFSISELRNCDFSRSEFIGCRFTVPHGAVLDIAWAPGDQAVVGVDALGNALMWRGQKLKEVAFERISRSWLRSLVPVTGDRLVAGGDDSELILVRAQDLKVLDRKRVGGMYWIRALAVADSRDLVFSGSEDGCLRLWNIYGDRLHLRGTWPLRRGAIRSVKVLADGSAVAACDQGAIARVEPSHSGVSYFKLGDTQVRCLDVEGRRGLVAAFADDVGLWVVEVASGETATMAPRSSGSIRTLSWAADGLSVVASGDDGVVWRWPVARSGTSLSIGEPSVIASLPGRVVALKVAHAGSNVVLSCEGETTYLADLETKQVFPLSKGNARRIWTVSGSPDGVHFISGGEDRILRVWRRRDGASDLGEVGTLPHGGRVWRGRYSEDSRWICTASDDNLVRVWNARDLSLEAAWSGHRDWVLDVAPYTTDSGDYVLSASNDQRVGVWRIGDGLANWCHHHDARVLRLAAWRNGRAISSSSDESIALFDPLTGQVDYRGTLRGHKAWGLDVSVQTREVATGGDDGRVCIWHVDGQGPTPVVIGELGGSVLEVRFCQEGQILLAASFDSGGLWVFRRKSGSAGWGAGKQLLDRHRIRAIWEMDDGSILTGGSDEDLAIFDITAMRLIGEVRIPRVYEGSNFREATGLHSVQRLALSALGGVDAEL